MAARGEGSRGRVARLARRAIGLAAPCVVAASVAGCGGSDASLVDVRGLVTYQGRPARAEVHFIPQQDVGRRGGRASIGTTDADGRYRLAWTAGRSGALPGRHRVLIRVLHPLKSGATATFEQASGAVRTVELERTVGPDADRFDFALTW